MIGVLMLLAAQAAPARVELPSTPKARSEAQRYGFCIADNSPEKASTTLRQDFRTASYKASMKVLNDNNRDCFRYRGRMRVSTLLIAGAMAERLLWRSGADTIGKRLAIAAGRPSVPTFAPSDVAAMCVVRSDPDGVSRLFATAPGTEDEVKVITPLRALIGRCTNQSSEGSDEGLRAILATAAYRSAAALNDGKTS